MKKEFHLELVVQDDGKWLCKTTNAGFNALELAWFFHDKTCDIFKQGLGLIMPEIDYKRTVLVCTKCGAEVERKKSRVKKARTK